MLIELPDDLQTLLEQDAARAGVTVEERAVDYIAERLQLKIDLEEIKRRAERGRGLDLRAVLDRVPDVPPMPGDELPEGWNES